MVRLVHLYRRRLEAGLTQDELAAMAGRSRFAISQIEQLRTEPRVTTIRRLAEALKCAPGELMEPPAVRAP
jgi:transcriptional regulator with XRE-family HTH domain